MGQTAQREPDQVLPNGDGRIVCAIGVCGGRPRIRGTRITVADLLNALAADDTMEELVEDLPGLSRDDVFAALKFAAANVDEIATAAA
jgi:uncharacterized protein (DUF433 family)